MRGFYIKRTRGMNCDFEFPAGSFLEFQVQENQSKLRGLETMVNSLQSLIDVKDDEVRVLKKKLDKVWLSNADLSRKLGLKEEKVDTGMEVLLTVRVFEAMLNDSVKLMRCFTKFLIDLMRRAGWDLEKAANSVYSRIDCLKKGHFRYAFLSYVCLGMCQNFDKNDFGLCDSEITCHENDSKHIVNGVIDGEDNGYLKQLIEHVASKPMEILVKNPKDTTLDAFVKYFGKYGEITDSVILKDRHTGRPRGFGFIIYADPSIVDTVIAETHIINGKQVINLPDVFF